MFSNCLTIIIPSIAKGRDFLAVSRRDAISFGMVYILVGLCTVTQDNDSRFNQFCKVDDI